MKLTCQNMRDVFDEHTLYYHSIDKYGEQFITWEATGGAFDILMCGEYYIKTIVTTNELQNVLDFLGIFVDVDKRIGRRK